MRAFFDLILALALLSPASAWSRVYALDFHRYHNQDEIAHFMREQARKYPELARFEILGKSQQGREVGLLTLTSNRNTEGPAIYLNATHHGNEKASTEALLALTDHLIENRDDALIGHLLRRYKILIQPLVNPDGHAHNTRGDAQGNDPNRDYASPSRAEKEAFQLPETRLVKALLHRENVVASASYHSGLEAVLWPWCHSPELSQHDSVFKGIAELVARSLGSAKARQSFYDYKTDGEFIDYAYMKYGTYALTLEVATESSPAEDQLGATVRRSLAGSLIFLHSVDKALERREQPSPIAEAQASLL